MYELKKNLKGIYKQICWDWVLVLWKKNLPGRGLTKVEKHWSRTDHKGPNGEKRCLRFRVDCYEAPICCKCHKPVLRPRIAPCHRGSSSHLYAFHSVDRVTHSLQNSNSNACCLEVQLTVTNGPKVSHLL